MNKMKTITVNPSWFFRLLILSTIWPVVELSTSNATDSEPVLADITCSVNITDFEDAQEKFHEHITVQKARVLNILISGIEWSDSSNETDEVFDPNLWTWATKESDTLAQMPIDHSVLSFGLTHLAIMDFELSIGSFPTGCVHGLTFEQQRKLVMTEVLRLTKNGVDDEDLICQSDYSQRSLITGRFIGVGKMCCNRGGVRGGRVYADCDRHQKTAYRSEGFAERFAVISVFGFLLPFFLIPCAMAWWQYNPLSFSESFAEYLSNKLDKVSIFRLVSRDHAIEGESRANGKFSGRYVIIEDNELESYETPATILDLLDINMRGVSRGKVKLTLLFLFQFVPVIAWLRQYSNMSNTLRRLNSAEKILFNLHNNPYSWLWTDRSKGPYFVALVLVFLNFLLVLFLSLWWLMEFGTVRLGFAKCLRLEAHDQSSLRKSKQIVKRMFKIFFVSLVLFSYVSVYSMFNCIIYIIGGLIVSIDIVSPWLTCTISVIYYIQRSCRKLTETYTEIKRLVFKVCERVKSYKATHKATAEIVKMRKNDLVMSERTFHYQLEVFEGPIWFVRVVTRDPEESRTQKIRTISSSIEMEYIRPLISDSCEDIKIDIEETDDDVEEGIGHRPNATSQESIGHLPGTGQQGTRNRSDASNQEGTDPEEQEGTGIQKIMMSKATLRSIYEAIEPVKRGVTKAAVKLIFTVLFVLLVVITTVAFRPEAVTGGAGLFITSLSTLLGSLIPLMIEVMAKSTAAESQLEDDVLEFNIRKLLFVVQPNFNVVERASSHEPLPPQFLQETDKIEMGNGRFRLCPHPTTFSGDHFLEVSGKHAETLHI